MIGGFCSVFEGEREVRGRGGDAQFIAGGVADAEGGVEFAGWRSEVMVCPPGDCSCEHQRDHDGDDREWWRRGRRYCDLFLAGDVAAVGCGDDGDGVGAGVGVDVRASAEDSYGVGGSAVSPVEAVGLVGRARVEVGIEDGGSVGNRVCGDEIERQFWEQGGIDLELDLVAGEGRLAVGGLSGGAGVVRARLRVGVLDSVGTGDAGRLGVAELILELGEAGGRIGGDGEVNGLSGERVGLAGGEGKGCVRCGD